MTSRRRGSGGGSAIAFAAIGGVLKLLLAVLVYAMPVLGFWLASSLAAYRGGATWVQRAATFGDDVEIERSGMP
jgi:hypothetical protein